MEGTIEINNCGVYTKVSKKELCGKLLKNRPQYYKVSLKIVMPMFDTETDLLISKLQEAIGIQIYKTGVVRLFFESSHFEERYTIYLRDLSNKILEILKTYN